MVPIRTDLLSSDRILTQEESGRHARLRRDDGHTLDHKTFENEIPAFLADRLDNGQLQDFLRHYDSCQVCQDELYIQYLVKEGLPKLETGETFNLQKEVDGYIREERLHLFRRTRLRIYAITLEVITLAAYVAAVVGAAALVLR